MAYGKIQTVATFSDNQDYSDPMTRLKHTTTLSTPTEAMTFRAQAGPYGGGASDGIRALETSGAVGDLYGPSIENVVQTIVTNRSSTVDVWVQSAIALTTVTGLSIDIDADGGEGGYCRVTRNGGSDWDFAGNLLDGQVVQFTAALPSPNTSLGGAGKAGYFIVAKSATTMDLQVTSGFSDATGSSASFQIIQRAIHKCPAGCQLIIAGAHPSTPTNAGLNWATWTDSGTADVEYMIMGTT